jgi:hypothetical protein
LLNKLLEKKMKFRASVQYGDWKGTAAADNADFNAIQKKLRETGILTPSEFLVGFEAYAGETRGDEGPYFSCRAFIIDGDKFETAKAAVDAQNPIPVIARDMELSLLDFFALFKRFDMVLTHRGLEIEGRDYREV